MTDENKSPSTEEEKPVTTSDQMISPRWNEKPEQNVRLNYKHHRTMKRRTHYNQQ